jgi:uncharacterized protein (DUF885 family)
MIRFRHFSPAAACVIALILCACNGPAPAPAGGAPPAVPRERLSHLVERYWDENAAANPWYSWEGAEWRYAVAAGDAIAPQALADSLAMDRRYLADVHDLSRDSLDPDAQLTYDLFRRERELAIEGLTYPMELMPVNPYDSVPQRFAIAAAAAENRAVAGDAEFDAWRKLARNYVLWTNQAIANMRDGARRGYTLPKGLVERMLPQLAALADERANPFYPAAAAAAADHKRLASAVADEIRDEILPSYRLLHDFLQREYLPRSRDSVGLAALPLGDAWYAYLVKRVTGGARNQAALHALGLAELERLHGRTQALLAETAFTGNLPGFIDELRRDPRWSYQSPAELLAAYQALKSQALEAAPTVLSVMPRTDVDIRAMDIFLQATSPALSYQRAAADGTRGAVLYVNTAFLEARPAIDMDALFLREAVPGHHYQLSLQQESSDLPRFRRFGGAPAYLQGWGLYAATLGEDMGIYRDSAAKFGSLLAQMQCAALMVVDTGLHAQGWSRQQALDFLHAQIPSDDATLANEVDRTIALPGEALACTVGLLDFQSWRARAREALGERFDLKTFHSAILKDGAMPLDILDSRMKRWLDTAVAAPPVPSAAPAAEAEAPAAARPDRRPTGGDTR